MTRFRDLLHELRIDWARRRLLQHPSRVNARRFHLLLNARSLQQVARMESKINAGKTNG